MTKQTAYEELCKEFDKGKRKWSFDEMADVLKREMGIPKEKTHQILNDVAKEQKEMKK